MIAPSTPRELTDAQKESLVELIQRSQRKGENIAISFGQIPRIDDGPSIADVRVTLTSLRGQERIILNP